MPRGPDAAYDRVADISLDAILVLGARGILIDLDNTLSPYTHQEFAQDTREWIDSAKKAGLLCVIVSNGRERRVAQAGRALNLPYIYAAGKPYKKAFCAGCAALKLAPNQCVMIGDQWITDVYGAKRAGLRTILVNPIDLNEFIGTRINRVIERVWMRLINVRRVGAQT